VFVDGTVEVPVGTDISSSDKVLYITSVQIVTRLWDGWGLNPGRE
jgi:hypothetical protein